MNENVHPLSIPEMLGFSRIPFDRERPFSVNSYTAQYALTVAEAEDVISTHRNHPAINRSLAFRFKDDPTYRKRVLGRARENDLSEEEGAA